MLIDQASPSTVAQVVKQYEALLALEASTHTKTTRARNDLLQSLGSADLLAVSLELQSRGLLNGGSR